jgi:predicted SnoaL-like aldol condensation-catalyzing enzyme
MNELTYAMIAVQKQTPEGILKESKANFKLSIKQVIVEGDMIDVYAQMASLKPSEGGLKQVHIFGFITDKIVEYWDITQNTAENASNGTEAFS